MEINPEVELKHLVLEQKPAVQVGSNTSGVHVKDEITPAEVKSEAAKTIEAAANKDNRSGGEDDILKPGSKIRPLVSEDEAVRLAERLYGITTKEISELISYDDRNFLIQVDSNVKNPIIPKAWPHGYVLKIANSLDSKKEGFMAAQTQLLLFLVQQGVQCPRPVMNIFGKYFSVENLEGSHHMVRLLEFQPGKVFNDVIKTNNLYYQVGEFVATFDLALKHFSHDAFLTHKTLWMLDSIHNLDEFLYAVEDGEKKFLVEQVLHTFKRDVLDHSNKFARGIIHGDFNEQNILVNSTDKQYEYKVTGIIDFGDTSLSLYVFELAIAISYMIIQSEDLDTAGYVIAGYEMIRPIPDNEKRVLKVCIAARLCQSLVLGLYSYSLDPGNDYLLFTQKAGWKLLKELWDQENETLQELWFSTADHYLKQSNK